MPSPPSLLQIDDGLELRKAAFECMDILLDACRAQIEATTFMQHLESGLQVGGEEGNA